MSDMHSPCFAIMGELFVQHTYGLSHEPNLISISVFYEHMILAGNF